MVVDKSLSALAQATAILALRRSALSRMVVTGLRSTACLAGLGRRGSGLGYRLHCGTASHNYTQIQDVGNATTVTVSNLTAGQIYFFCCYRVQRSW